MDNITNIQSQKSLRMSFLSDILKLAGGTAVAQILGILAVPIITRLYGPDAFGLSALFASIVGIISIIVCLRYELAIMLPDKEEEAANILALSLFITLIISILTVPLVWLGQQSLVHMLKEPTLALYLWLVPPSVFLNGVFSALTYWNSRTRRFGSLSIARVTNSMVNTGTQLGAGLEGYATGGSLIGAGLAGSIVSTLMLGGRIWREDKLMFVHSINCRDIAMGINRYKKFPLYDIWGALLNNLSWQLPIFLLSSYFSSKIVGYYALGMMVLQFPTTLIGSAISQVFFQRSAKAAHDGTLPNAVEDALQHLAIIGLYPFLLLSLIGEDIFVVVFGAQWSEAGMYVQILALWIFFVFITSPITTLFSVLEKQRAFLLFNIFLFISRALTLTLGGLSGNIRFTLTIFSLVGIIGYAAICSWLLNKTNVMVSGIFEKVSKYLYYCIPALGLVFLAKWILSLSPQMTFLIGCITIIIYYILVIKQERLV